MNLFRVIPTIIILKTRKKRPHEKLICSVWSEGKTKNYFSAYFFLRKKAPEYLKRYERFLDASKTISKQSPKGLGRRNAASTRKG